MNETGRMYDFSLIPEWVASSNVFSVVITDMIGNYIYVNRHFQDRFNWLTNDLIGKPFSITVHPHDIEKCNEVAYKCLTTPDAFIEIEIRKPQNEAGDFIWTNWEFSQFQDINGKPIGVFCLGYDITEFKFVLHDLIKKNLLLNDIAKTQSHAVRGPVARILGLIELILLDKDKEKKDVIRYLDFLKIEVNNLDTIIHKVVGMTQNK